MRKYTLTFEDTNECRTSARQSLLAGGFDGWTETAHVGFWLGEREESRSISIVDFDDADDTLSALRIIARTIAVDGNQCSVLLECSEVAAAFITGHDGEEDFQS